MSNTVKKDLLKEWTIMLMHDMIDEQEFIIRVGSINSLNKQNLKG